MCELRARETRKKVKSRLPAHMWYVCMCDRKKSACEREKVDGEMSHVNDDPPSLRSHELLFTMLARARIQLTPNLRKQFGYLL